MEQDIKVYGGIGDINPLEHGGGVVVDSGEGAELFYFVPDEDLEHLGVDTGKVEVYRVLLEDPEEALCFVDWAQVARYVGEEEEVLRGTGESVVARALVYETVGHYYGFANLDDNPLVLDAQEAEKRFGPLVDRCLN